ncbi:hypothetical protein IKP85_01900 [bacterium]|nr:hypothetical protein [bacterium]
MKKFIMAALVLAMTSGIAMAYDPAPLMPLVNEIGTMQNANSQMKQWQEYQFRQEEYNDDIQEAKARRAKQYQQYQEEKTKLYSPNQNLDFVRENGHIILKSVD